MEQARKPGELIFNGLMFLLSAILLWYAYKISGFSSFSAPGTFPMSAAFIMLFFSGVTFLKSLKKNKISGEFVLFFKNILPVRIAFMMMLILVFSLVLESVGFLISSFVLLSVAFYFYHKRNVVSSFMISIMALIIVYAIFRLVFLVILPEGVFPEAEVLAFISDLFS